MLIEKVFWKRTYLIVDYKKGENETLALRNTESGRIVPFESRVLKNDLYRGKINITIADGRRVMEAGVWEFIDSDNSDSDVVFSECIYENLTKCQRVFKYTSRYYANIYTLDLYNGKPAINNAFFRVIDRNMTYTEFGKKFDRNFVYQNETVNLHEYYVSMEKLYGQEVDFRSFEEVDSLNSQLAEEGVIPLVEVTELEWEDGILKIKYNATEEDYQFDCKLMGYNWKKSLIKELKCKVDNNVGEVRIPIIDLKDLTIFDRGVWRLYIKGTLYPIHISDEIMLHLEDYNRVFLTEDKNYAITVCPLITESSTLDRQELKLEISYMQKYDEDFSKNTKTAKMEAGTFKQYLRKLFFIYAKATLNAFYQVCLKFHKFDGKNILLMSENRPRIMDNLEAIDIRLKERGLDKTYNISYNFRNIFKPFQNPFSWLKTIMKIAKQDYIFVDDYVPIFQFLELPEETTLVQVWHAGFGFKLVGYGRYGIAGSPHPIKSCHRKYDYALIGNDHLREIYSEVFGIEKEALLATGMPRLEHFLDEERMTSVRESIYKEFPEFVGKKIITFAPTYRGGSQKTAYYDFDQLDFDEIYKYCKENNAVFIVKQHHFLREKAQISKNQRDIFYELSEYNLNDLFYVTDILITDYSSCFYDFLLLKKPVLFFTYDKAVYSATRGVHRPIDEVAPGKVCNNFEELMNALRNEDYGSVEAAEFLQDKCVTNDVIASDKAIDYILLKKKVDDICIG